MLEPIPTATYRFQLTPTFGFAASPRSSTGWRRSASATSTCRRSPRPCPGSTHGYDVVDHTRVRDELGGLDGLTALLDALAGRGWASSSTTCPTTSPSAGPSSTRRWWAMLRDGPDERGRALVRRRLGRPADGKVILPVLGEPLDDVAGELTIVDGELRLGAQRWPLAPGTERLPTGGRCSPASTTACSGGATRRATCGGSSPSTTSWPCASRTPRSPPSSTPCPACSPTTRRSPASASTTSTGWPTRWRYLDGLRDADRRPLAARREDPRRRRDAARRLAGRRHDRLRARHRARARPARPRRLGPAAAALGRRSTGDGRPFRAWELEARREVLDGGLRPDLERVARVAADRLEADEPMVEAAVAELSVHLERYRTYLPDDEGDAGAATAARRGRGGPPRPAPPCSTRSSPCSATPTTPRPRVADPLAAADRPGDGQGRRGPGVLALRAAGVARRGRRRGRAGRDDRPGRRAARPPRRDGRHGGR